MDFLQDQILAQLPPPVQDLARQILPYLSYATRTLQYSTTSFILPFLKFSTNYLRTTEQNPLLVIIGLIATLFISLRVLGWVQRQIFGWIYLLVQFGLVAGLGLIGFAVWTFGAQECVQFLVRLGEMLQDGKTEGARGMHREGERIRREKW